MGRIWNSDAIQDTMMFDSGPYLFTVESLEEGRTRAGAFAYKARLRCTEGKADFIGGAKFETFTMGTDSDPDWQDPDTVGPGARGFKNLLRGLGLDVAQSDVDELIAQAVGGTVGGIVSKELDKGGVMRDNVTRWYPAAATATLTQPTPKAVAKPQPKAAVAAGPAPARAASAKPDPPVKCGVCNEQVLRSQFGAHVTAHES